MPSSYPINYKVMRGKYMICACYSIAQSYIIDFFKLCIIRVKFCNMRIFNKWFILMVNDRMSLYPAVPVYQHYAVTSWYQKRKQLCCRDLRGCFFTCMEVEGTIQQRKECKSLSFFLKIAKEWISFFHMF